MWGKFSFNGGHLEVFYFSVAWLNWLTTMKLIAIHYTMCDNSVVAPMCSLHKWQQHLFSCWISLENVFWTRFQAESCQMIFFLIFSLVSSWISRSRFVYTFWMDEIHDEYFYQPSARFRWSIEVFCLNSIAAFSRKIVRLNGTQECHFECSKPMPLWVICISRNRIWLKQELRFSIERWKYPQKYFSLYCVVPVATTNR